MERYSSSVVLQEVTSLICKWNQHNTWCYPKIRGIYTERPNRLSYALPPLDVASGMLCESVCQRLWSWEDVLLSSVRFCEITFQWSGGFFFLQLIWPILRSKESASNFVSIIKKKLLQKPIECYRKPSEMSWDKAKLFYSTNASKTNERLSKWAFWTTVDKHNTGKHSKSSRGYPCRS